MSEQELGTIEPPPEDRRSFGKQLLAVIISVVAVLPAIGAGLAVWFHPLRRKGGSGGGGAGESGKVVEVTTLNSLPMDGRPRRFPVLMARRDAWTQEEEAPVGAVYLRRVGEREVRAFNVVCPHAGCFVDYKANANSFQCPCHDSTFGLDGRILNPGSPSPRGLDELEVEIRGGAIWVRFQNFQAGTPEKVPVT